MRSVLRFMLLVWNDSGVDAIRFLRTPALAQNVAASPLSEMEHEIRREALDIAAYSEVEVAGGYLFLLAAIGHLGGLDFGLDKRQHSLLGLLPKTPFLVRRQFAAG